MHALKYIISKKLFISSVEIFTQDMGFFFFKYK